MARMGGSLFRNDVFLHSGDAKDKNDYDSLIIRPGKDLSAPGTGMATSSTQNDTWGQEQLRLVVRT